MHLLPESCDWLFPCTSCYLNPGTGFFQLLTEVYLLLPESCDWLFPTVFQLLVPFDSGEVLEMLRRILEKQEVNWQMLLSCMATFLICFPSAATDIQGWLGQWDALL